MVQITLICQKANLISHVMTLLKKILLIPNFWTVLFTMQCAVNSILEFHCEQCSLLFTYLQLLHQCAGLLGAAELLWYCTVQALEGPTGGGTSWRPISAAQQDLSHNLSRGFEHYRKIWVGSSIMRGSTAFRRFVSTVFRETNPRLHFGEIR